MSCELLTTGDKCLSCKAYRDTIRSIYNRWVRRSSSDMSDTRSHSNERYLDTLERKKKMSS